MKKRIKQAWVAVDGDGTEHIFATKPMRRKDVDGSKIKSIWWGIQGVFYSKNQWRKWYAGWSTNDDNALPQHSVVLPKGTIFVLTGEQLTWQNDPINLHEIKSSL